MVVGAEVVETVGWAVLKLLELWMCAEVAGEVPQNSATDMGGLELDYVGYHHPRNSGFTNTGVSSGSRSDAIWAVFDRVAYGAVVLPRAPSGMRL